MNWKKLTIPGLFFERVLGFSLPVQGRVAIVAYDAVHIIDVDRETLVIRDESLPEGGALFDAREPTLRYAGVTFPMLSLHGGDPHIQSKRGETLYFDTSRQALIVLSDADRTFRELPYEDFSGDWACATFSPDDNLILLGVPYNLFLFRREGGIILVEIRVSHSVDSGGPIIAPIPVGSEGLMDSFETSFLLCTMALSLIPGPRNLESPILSLTLDEIEEYPVARVAATISAIPNVSTVSRGSDAAIEAWFAWKWRWAHEDRYIDIDFSVFEIEPPSWGGSQLHPHCTYSDLLLLWKGVRSFYPGTWLHDRDCVVWTPRHFVNRFAIPLLDPALNHTTPGIRDRAKIELERYRLLLLQFDRGLTGDHAG